MNAYITRIATPDDAESVEAVLKASYPRLMASDYEPAVLEAALKLITRANPGLLASGTYYVAQTRDGTVVGCGGWTRNRPTESDTDVDDCAHLRHFATHPDWAGRGVGRAIFRACEQTVRSAGVARLEVYSSLNAEPFYAAMGFARVELVAVPVGPVRFPSVLMQRSV